MEFQALHVSLTDFIPSSQGCGKVRCIATTALPAMYISPLFSIGALVLVILVGVCIAIMRK